MKIFKGIISGILGASLIGVLLMVLIVRVGNTISEQEAISRFQVAVQNSLASETYWWQEWFSEEGVPVMTGEICPRTGEIIPEQRCPRTREILPVQRVIDDVPQYERYDAIVDGVVIPNGGDFIYRNVGTSFRPDYQRIPILEYRIRPTSGHNFGMVLHPSGTGGMFSQGGIIERNLLGVQVRHEQRGFELWSGMSLPGGSTNIAERRNNTFVSIDGPNLPASASDTLRAHTRTRTDMTQVTIPNNASPSEIDRTRYIIENYVNGSGLSLVEAMMEVAFIAGVELPSWINSHYPQLQSALESARGDDGFLSATGLPSWITVDSASGLGFLTEISLEVSGNTECDGMARYFEWFYETFGFASSLVPEALREGHDIYTLRIELVDDHFSVIEVAHRLPLVDIFGWTPILIDVVVYELSVFHYGPNMQLRLPRYTDTWEEFGVEVTWNLTHTPLAQIFPLGMPNFRVEGLQ